MPLAFLAAWAQLAHVQMQPTSTPGPFPLGSFPVTLCQPAVLQGPKSRTWHLALLIIQLILAHHSSQSESLLQINTSIQHKVIFKLAEGTLEPPIQIIDKDIRGLAPTLSSGEHHC